MRFKEFIQQEAAFGNNSQFGRSQFGGNQFGARFRDPEQAHDNVVMNLTQNLSQLIDSGELSVGADGNVVIPRSHLNSLGFSTTRRGPNVQYLKNANIYVLNPNTNDIFQDDGSVIISTANLNQATSRLGLKSTGQEVWGQIKRGYQKFLGNAFSQSKGGGLAQSGSVRGY